MSVVFFFFYGCCVVTLYMKINKNFDNKKIYNNSVLSRKHN